MQKPKVSLILAWTAPPRTSPQAHLIEEEILSRATGFAADEVLRLPPRLPGQGLHQSLIDAARVQDEVARRAELREAKIRAREAADADAVAAAVADGPGDPSSDNQEGAGVRGRGSASGGGGGGKPSNGKVSTAAEAAAAAALSGNDGAAGDDYGELSGEDDDNGEIGINNEIDGDEAAVAVAAAYGDESWLETGEEVLARAGGGAVPEWDKVPTAREEGRAHDVVVTGPSLSGKSTLSRALAARYGLPALTIDGTVKEALRLRNKLGARVRAAIHWFTAKEKARTFSSVGLFRNSCISWSEKTFVA